MTNLCQHIIWSHWNTRSAATVVLRSHSRLHMQIWPTDATPTKILQCGWDIKSLLSLLSACRERCRWRQITSHTRWGHRMSHITHRWLAYSVVRWLILPEYNYETVSPDGLMLVLRSVPVASLKGCVISHCLFLCVQWMSPWKTFSNYNSWLWLFALAYLFACYDWAEVSSCWKTAAHTMDLFQLTLPKPI